MSFNHPPCNLVARRGVAWRGVAWGGVAWGGVNKRIRGGQAPFIFLPAIGECEAAGVAVRAGSLATVSCTRIVENGGVYANREPLSEGAGFAHPRAN